MVSRNDELIKIDLSEFGNLFRTDPTKLADQELLSLDFMLHRAWKPKQDGGEVYFGDKSWCLGDLVNLHALVKQEMSRREFKHTMSDELDDQTRPILKGMDELAPVYPSGVELGRPVTLDEVLPQIKSFYPNPIFGWIVGGLANWGKTKGDIDVLWWAPPEFPVYLKKIIEVRFGRQFKDSEIAGRVQHHLNIFQGPFSKAVPVYALKVERINLQGEIKEAALPGMSEIGIDAEPVDLVWDDLKKGWTVPESCVEQMRALIEKKMESGITGQSGSASDEVVAPAEESEKSESVLQENEIILDGDTALKGIRQAFGSYGGKRALAHKIASFIPHHRTYVEPFAGGAAVLFAKDYSPKEVLNDRDSEIAFMYRFIKNHTLEDRQALAKRDWVIRKAVHERLKKMKPESERDRFYKNYYLTRSSYGKQRGGSFNPANAGVKIDFQKNIERAQGRLQNVTVYNKDYIDVLKEYDGEDTFFYMDPPYPDTFNLFDFGFKEAEFLKAIKKLKAKWIVSYPVHKANVLKGFNVTRVKRRNQMRGPGGNKEWVTEIMASNFPLEPLNLYIDKDLTPDPEGMESDAVVLFPHVEEGDDLEKIQGAFKSPGGKFRLCKKLVPLIPEHKTFVEGFCGGAQVFFHKKRSDEEVLNDVNPDLIFAYRFIKSMSKKDHAWLEKQYWTISRTHVRKVFNHKPASPRERFYRVAYLNKANYWGRTDRIEGMRRGEKGEGYKIQLVKRLPQIKERLQGVKLLSKDWTEIIKTFDSPNTFFYLDPPYPLHWPKEGGGVGSKFFKEEDLLPALRKIKGRFLMSYELEKAKLFKGFKTYRVKTTWTGANQLGHRNKFELLVSNYPVKENELYVEKLLEPISLEPLIKQDEMFDVNPPEDKTYRYVMQHHWRGKTVHVDFRIESMDNDFVIGWTLADLIEGVVKDPVESLDAAKKWSEDGSAFKIDFKTGHFKERQTRSDNVVPAQLRAFPKAKEPHIWLDVEGQTDPFPAPGSTRQFRGIFLIEDKGECEYGAQKLDTHEYFLNGKIKGRLLIRRLARETLQQASENDGLVKVLPPGKIDEAPITDKTLWVAIQPIDQTPIVLNDREVNKAWIPPFGISALPKAVRDLIPEKYQYWKIQDRAKALENRDALVEAIKMGDMKIDFNFVSS